MSKIISRTSSSRTSEASTGIVELANVSAEVERIHGRKKVEHKQEYAEATYSIEAVKDQRKAHDS